VSARTDRARAVGLWLRDTGLGVTGYVLVAVVAVAGWSASFVGLHTFAVEHMALSDTAAWLVPTTFDGAALGLTVSVARAAMHGRGAMVWRVLVVAFTSLSSWINYAHITDATGQWVAALLPVSAVTVFESLMSEARSAYERRTGRTRPRIHPLRWVFDPRGTLAIVRAYVLDVPLPDRLATAREHARDTAREMPASVTVTPTVDTHDTAREMVTTPTVDMVTAPPASAREHAPEMTATPIVSAPVALPTDTSTGDRERDRETDREHVATPPATRTRTRSRTPSRTRPRATVSATATRPRRLYADILASAREALADDPTVTPARVREVTGCARSTATRIAAALTAERTPSARVLPITR
jgi:hypothetical protein